MIEQTKYCLTNRERNIRNFVCSLGNFPKILSLILYIISLKSKLIFPKYTKKPCKCRVLFSNVEIKRNAIPVFSCLIFKKFLRRIVGESANGLETPGKVHHH
jgi:hypothetical protein